MRVVVQRCKDAKVTVDKAVTGEIGKGLMLLVGVTHEDTEKDAKYLADKIAGLRIFEDDAGKMNYSVTETEGAILSVSQFTLYGDCRKGRRPNFMGAAAPRRPSDFMITLTKSLELAAFKWRRGYLER